MLLKRVLTTRNVGNLDRVLRALPLFIVAALWANGTVGGALAVGLAIAAAFAFLTAVLGACSIYYMLGWSTCPISGQPRNRL
jgi:Protein of unknown function (DUF2892)